MVTSRSACEESIVEIAKKLQQLSTDNLTTFEFPLTAHNRGGHGDARTTFLKLAFLPFATHLLRRHIEPPPFGQGCRQYLSRHLRLKL
jgi:hypothetical protein